MPRVEGGPTTVGADKAILASTCAFGFSLPIQQLDGSYAEGAQV